MNKAFKITSALCIVIALISIISSIIVIISSSAYMFGCSLFTLFNNNRTLAITGNLIIMIAIAISYGATGFFGTIDYIKAAFVWAIIASVFAVISCIAIIISSCAVTNVDIFIIAIPIAQLFCLHISDK